MSVHMDHGWRADEYNLIRGDLHASVNRAWCADTDGGAWRWTLYTINEEGGVDLYPVPADVRRGGFPAKGEALLACERFMSSLTDGVNPNVYAFAGAEVAP